MTMVTCVVCYNRLHIGDDWALTFEDYRTVSGRDVLPEMGICGYCWNEALSAELIKRTSRKEVQKTENKVAKELDEEIKKGVREKTGGKVCFEDEISEAEQMAAALKGATVIRREAIFASDALGNKAKYHKE